VKTKPRKRKKRLSEHAKLVEARAASIPPRVVHELFDTASVPQPPGPAPRRSVAPAPGRFASKPPPHPPRPSHAPAGDIPEANLDELEELASDAVHEAHEDSDATRGYETQTQTFIPTVSPPPGEGQALQPAQRRSALPAVILGSLAAVGLAFAMFADRSRTAEQNGDAVATEPVLPAAPAPPSPEPLSPPAADPGPLPTEPSNPAPIAAEPAPDVAVAAAAVALPSPPAAVEESPSSTTAASPDVAASAPKAQRSAPVGDGPAFDEEFASAAIRAAFARAQGCRSGSDPTGLATVTVTYAPSGRVTRTLVDGVFAGTPVGSCIAATLRSATIPVFSGALVTVKRSAEIR